MPHTPKTCSGVHVSSVAERTLEMCTPSDLCTPEHLMHTKRPRLTDAHVGPRSPQSAQNRLSGSLSALASTCGWVRAGAGAGAGARTQARARRRQSGGTRSGRGGGRRGAASSIPSGGGCVRSVESVRRVSQPSGAHVACACSERTKGARARCPGSRVRTRACAARRATAAASARHGAALAWPQAPPRSHALQVRASAPRPLQVAPSGACAACGSQRHTSVCEAGLHARSLARPHAPHAPHGPPL